MQSNIENTNYQVVISPDTLAKLDTYKQNLIQGEQAGPRLTWVLNGSHIKEFNLEAAQKLKINSQVLQGLSTNDFVAAILNTKSPTISGFKDPRAEIEWNGTEKSLLPRLGIVSNNVTVYDDCALGRQAKHEKFLEVNLVFINGLLMREGFPDYELVMADGKFNKEKYMAELAERLLPPLVQANSLGKKVEVRMPAAGCKMYARGITGSEITDKDLVQVFIDTIEQILKTNKFENIASIDMQEHGYEFNQEINGVKFTCNNTAVNKRQAVLAAPNSPENYIVAFFPADHFAHPGNEGLGGKIGVASIGGQACYSTDFLSKIYGIDGSFNGKEYQPKEKTWKVHSRNSTFINPIIMVAVGNSLVDLREFKQESGQTVSQNELMLRMQEEVTKLRNECSSVEEFASKIFQTAYDVINQSNLSHDQKIELQKIFSDVSQQIKETDSHQGIVTLIQVLHNHGLTEAFVVSLECRSSFQSMVNQMEQKGTDISQNI